MIRSPRPSRGRRSASTYTQFVILGRARSGSTFLRGLLNGHDQVVAFGELFRFPNAIGWDLPEYESAQQAQELIRLSQTDPPEFLKQAVFKDYPPDVRAVGFKLFYYHAQKGTRKAVWAHLRSRPAIRIIHLERRNLLAQILSEKRAFATDRWANTTGEPEEQRPIVLEYEECWRMFHRAGRIRESFNAYFSDHAILHLVYEDLANDYRRQMARVQDFLGVETRELRPTTYKQVTAPLCEAITNYEQLRERFAGSPWEPLFLASHE